MEVGDGETGARPESTHPQTGEGEERRGVGAGVERRRRGPDVTRRDGARAGGRSQRGRETVGGAWSRRIQRGRAVGTFRRGLWLSEKGDSRPPQ